MFTSENYSHCQEFVLIVLYHFYGFLFSCVFSKCLLTCNGLGESRAPAPKKPTLVVTATNVYKNSRSFKQSYVSCRTCRSVGDKELGRMLRNALLRRCHEG